MIRASVKLEERFHLIRRGFVMVKFTQVPKREGSCIKLMSLVMMRDGWWDRKLAGGKLMLMRD